MAEEAIAILFSGDPDTERSSMDVFRESENVERDPLLRAELLMRSCQDDFPNRLWTLTGNGRAKQLATRRRMLAMGFTPEDLEEAHDD